MTTRLQCANVIAKCRWLLVSASVSGLIGCSGTDDQTSPSGNGGADTVGGATGAGGTSSSSVVNGTGGAQPTGGTIATGGVVATGGAANATGGKAATGGAANATGGKAATGGAANATGGDAPTGGAVNATGGKAATGGVNAGGANATGGTTTAGGANVTGGKAATGGVNAGGANATGGSAAMGGVNAGGANATGGTTTAGGASSNRSPGCGTTINRPNNKTQQTMTISGTTRYYLLDVPTAADNSTPLMLIFALHGYDMNNVSIVGLYNFTSRSNGKAITVYPQGEGPAPGDTSHWGDGVLKSTWTANDANYTFMQSLMTDLESRFCIDPNRVYFTGFSMGGMFTNSIACDHSSWFRGYAPVEGMGPGSCSDQNAKPAIMIHQGTADTTVTPTAGGEATRDFWIAQNGCNQTTTSSFTGCTSYSGCAQPVVYCVGNWNHTISSTATANIWSFFSGLQ